MTYTSKITLKFDSTWEQTRGIYDEEMIPEEHITFECPGQDLNTTQLFKFFEKFAFAMGYNETSICAGATALAFNEMRSMEVMRKTAEDQDLVLKEDYIERIREYEEELRQAFSTIKDLKAKLSRLENPDNPQYTDEEMDALCAVGATSTAVGASWNPWNNLVPGSYVAVQNGCKCPVMDNEEMPDDKKWVNGDCPIHGKV